MMQPAMHFAARLVSALVVLSMVGGLVGCDPAPSNQDDADTQTADALSDADGEDDATDSEDIADTTDVDDASDDADMGDTEDTRTFVDDCQCVGADCGLDGDPTARIELRQDGQVVTAPLETRPFTTVEFDGTSSDGPNSAAVELEYNWRLIDRPNQFRQTFSRNETVAEPRLFLDLAGEYVVELQVRTKDGTAACSEPTQVTINATPDADVYAELITVTPSDDDRTDDLGPTVTLHYLHPQGVWGTSKWDCSWENPNPDWGAQGDDTDDPTLVSTAIGEVTPEVVKHSKLESLIYQLGFYYLKGDLDGSPVTTYATLRVYIEGSLAAEIEDVEMDREQEFYRAGYVDGDALEWQETGRMYDGFPNN